MGQIWKEFGKVTAIRVYCVIKSILHLKGGGGETVQIWSASCDLGQPPWVVPFLFWESVRGLCQESILYVLKISISTLPSWLLGYNVEFEVSRSHISERCKPSESQASPRVIEAILSSLLTLNSITVWHQHICFNVPAFWPSLRDALISCILRDDKCYERAISIFVKLLLCD